MAKNRLFYIDNLRIVAISLVILHHLAITYGGPGGWYYHEGQAGPVATIIYSLFVATNQSFFMGLLFFISAYFTHESYNRNGTKKFLSRRLLRLGVPLLLYFFILSPVTIYLLILHRPDSAISFCDFIKSTDGFGFGPLWFVEVLLVFTLLYAAVRLVAPSLFTEVSEARPMPRPFAIILFIVTVSAITFVIRIWLPVGWTLEPFNLQLAHYPQYLSLLFLGVAAHKKQWLNSLDLGVSLKWFAFAQVMIFFLFPLLFYLGGASSGTVDEFMGGLHLQSLAYSFWEQFTGISLMIGLLGLFRHKLNAQSALTRRLSESTYAAFIIHPPVLVFICLNLKTMAMPLFLKFIILAIPALTSCFILAHVLRKIPLLKKVL